MFYDTDFLKSDEIELKLRKLSPADPVNGKVPAYHFDIVSRSGDIMGECDLRLGHNERLYYGGNIGYKIEEKYRGHRYAAKSCRLLFELAKTHELEYLIITCDPDNIPSLKTCELLGGRFLGTFELPMDSDMRERGSAQKCIFRFEL